MSRKLASSNTHKCDLLSLEMFLGLIFTNISREYSI